MDTNFLNSLKEEILKVPHKVTLVAVTKGVGIEEVNAAIKKGVTAIGENRVEEFEKKISHLLHVEKHFIGQIQSRKIKRIVEMFDCIQSVGSIEHLKKIESEAINQNKEISAMLQFNISGEGQKGGFDPNEVGEITEAISNIHRVRIIGVMGMASNTTDTEIVRKQFRLLKKLRDQLRPSVERGSTEASRPNVRAKHTLITELSMGMSGDYKIALEEGATMLRIGRALFRN